MKEWAKVEREANAAFDFVSRELAIAAEIEAYQEEEDRFEEGEGDVHSEDEMSTLEEDQKVSLIQSLPSTP